MKTSEIPEWKHMDVVSTGVNIFKNTNDPRTILGVKEGFNEQDLKKAFVKKARMYKNTDKYRYDLCKNAFKELYENIS
jgi:hypothetical protein